MDGLKRSVSAGILTFAVLICTWAGQVRAQSDIKLDDIHVFYHGLILDRNLRPIELSAPQLQRLYLDVARAAFDASNDTSPFRAAVQSSQVLQTAAVTSKDTEVIGKMDFITAGFLSEMEASAVTREKLVRQRDALHYLARQTGKHVLPNRNALPDGLRTYFDTYAKSMEQPSKQDYKPCVDADVPVPPAYGHPDWSQKHIELDPYIALLQQIPGAGKEFPPSDIYFSKTDKGLCTLLKRYSARPVGDTKKDLQLMGVICESANTNESCAWDNNVYGKEGKFISEDDLAKDESLEQISKVWANSAQGSLSADCETCHAGDNAFIFYKDKNLCFDQKGACYAGNPGKAHTGLSEILGLDGVTKDVRLLPGSPVEKTNACLGCHTLAAWEHSGTYTTEPICNLTKFVVEKGLMPPGATKGQLKWENIKVDPDDTQESVNQLWRLCNP
jgi:hypothetical protein